jgi:hypothetical protein
MPGLGPGIHVYLAAAFVDGRVKPGHDDAAPISFDNSPLS